MSKEGKIGSIEVISGLIKQATLSKKDRERLTRELEQEGEGGKGTIWLQNEEEYEKAAVECNGDLLSPGGASARVGISRARLHQLEAEGKIRVFREKAKDCTYTEEEFKEVLKMLPVWVRPFITFKKPKDGCYIWVDMVSLEKYMAEESRKR